jgi:hypothetical protein
MMDWTDEAEFDCRLNELGAAENPRSLYVGSRCRFLRPLNVSAEATENALVTPVTNRAAAWRRRHSTAA